MANMMVLDDSQLSVLVRAEAFRMLCSDVGVCCSNCGEKEVNVGDPADLKVGDN